MGDTDGGRMNVPGIIVIALIGLCGVGGWQAYEHIKLQEKREFFEENLAKPPKPLTEILTEPVDERAYRRVVVVGSLTSKKSYLAANVLGSEEGAKVFTVLDVDGFERHLMADTGYVPAPPPPIRGRAEDAEEGEPPILTYTGVLVPAQEAGLLDWPDYARSLFYTPDIVDMASKHRVTIVPDAYLYIEGPGVKGRALLPFTRGISGMQLMIALSCLAFACLLGGAFFVLSRPEEEEETYAVAAAVERLPPRRKPVTAATMAGGGASAGAATFASSPSFSASPAFSSPPAYASAPAFAPAGYAAPARDSDYSMEPPPFPE